MEIIGHRGCEGIQPENSLAAMRKAIELGIHRVEFDVQKTKDGFLVLHHDATIKKGGLLLHVRDLTYKELMDATGKNKDLIPGLSDVLEACKGNIGIQLELKADAIENDVSTMLRDLDFPLKDITVSSFDFGRLVRVKACFPRLEPWQLVYLIRGGRMLGWFVKKMKKAGIGSVSLHVSSVNAGIIDVLHQQHGLRVLAFGIGDKLASQRNLVNTYTNLLATKLDGFTCAFPDVALAMLNNRGGA